MSMIVSVILNLNISIFGDRKVELFLVELYFYDTFVRYLFNTMTVLDPGRYSSDSSGTHYYIVIIP
jgi:hypothetical protein